MLTRARDHSLRAAGYAAKAAYTCGPRLLKVASVQVRVKELQQTVAAVVIERTAVDRAFVLRELKDNGLKAKQMGELSASNRAFELLGKDLGMFTPSELAWDGDPATLTDRQMEELLRYLERIAFNGDQTKIAAARQQAWLEAGLVIDVEPEPKPSEEEPSEGGNANEKW
jgi:hypothetical protein